MLPREPVVRRRCAPGLAQVLRAVVEQCAHHGQVRATRTLHRMQRRVHGAQAGGRCNAQRPQIVDGQQYARGRRPRRATRAARRVQETDALLGARIVALRRIDADVHTLIEQEHLHVLGTVRKEVQVQVGVARRAAIQDSAHQMGFKPGQALHPFEGVQAQGLQALGVLLSFRVAQMLTQRCLNLLAVGQGGTSTRVARDVRAGALPGVDKRLAFLGHELGGQRCDTVLLCYPAGAVLHRAGFPLAQAPTCWSQSTGLAAPAPHPLRIPGFPRRACPAHASAMHLHILGICGTFMGGLARLAQEAGHRVTGCDAAVYPPMSEQLRAAGIELVEGFGAEQLALNPDLYVVGNVVARGNPLFEAVLEARRPFVSGPEWVGRHILPGRHVLAVAGTHGKTTTSSLLAWILEAAGLEPGFLIGGVPLDFGRSARLGRGRPFVIEADEYDSALFDKRSKFVHYFPDTLILNNLEYDHADIFPDLAAIENQFHHLMRCVPRSGRVIANGADAALARVLARGAWCGVESFDRPDDWHWRADAGIPDGFGVWRGGQELGRLALALAGDHNRSNATAAIAAAAHLGIDPAQSIDALRRFGGVRRRLEQRGVVRGVSVYDDFAHHPTAIATTIAGLRRRVGTARILALLEPRSNTMRLGSMQALIPGSLAQADLVYCYAPRQGPHALGWDARATLAPLGERARVYDDIAALVAAVAAQAQAGDHVLAMSNGSFGGIHEKLLAALQPDAS